MSQFLLGTNIRSAWARDVFCPQKPETHKVHLIDSKLSCIRRRWISSATGSQTFFLGCFFFFSLVGKVDTKDQGLEIRKGSFTRGDTGNRKRHPRARSIPRRCNVLPRSLLVAARLFANEKRVANRKKADRKRSPSIFECRRNCTFSRTYDWLHFGRNEERMVGNLNTIERSLCK